MDVILESWMLEPDEYIKTVVLDGTTEIFLMKKHKSNEKEK